jgi:hypothetical protein
MNDRARELAGSGKDARAIADELDRLSRERELTKAESLLLERSLLIVDGRRVPPGLTKALARHGVKRDMRRYA